MKKYRRRALIFGCIAAVLALAGAIARPYIKALAAGKFIIWPSYLYGYVWRPAVAVLAALCGMNAVTALWGIRVKSRPLRVTLLALGIVLSAFYLYETVGIFIDFLPPIPNFSYGIAYWAALYPALFSVPVALLYLGASKPADE
jgi:hypothetical protein